jgi:endo-1,4-beta-xylanase
MASRKRRRVLQAVGVAVLAAAAGTREARQSGMAKVAAAPSPSATPTATGMAATIPIPLLGANPLSAFALGGSAARDAQMQVVAVAGQPFGQAIQVRTLQRPPQPYNIQLAARTVAPVERDDVLLATFYVRGIESTDETGEARTTIIFEQASDPYTKSLDFTVGALAGGKWQRIDIPFQAAGRYTAGQAQVTFRLGYAPQTIEIGGISVVNYQKSVRLSDLPITIPSYPGREADAAWRAAAAARIEALRKADLRVVVRDGSGAPVAGAMVAVRQQRHAFGFGSAVAAAQLVAQDVDGQRYRDLIVQLFSKVVLENDLKWSSWEDPRQRPRTMQALQWLQDQGLPIRGHNLVWPAWRWLPSDLAALKENPAALRQRVADHILDEVGTLAGQIVDWDVINEPDLNHDLMDLLGKDVMVEWFQLAHQADPNARLFVNEATVPAPGERQDHLEQTLRFLLAAGAPVGGIGIQCHYGWNVTPPDTLLRGLDRFAQLGLPIQITEFDIDVTDAQLQADYTRDLLTAAFSHPAVDAILMWGFWEGRHWRPNAALYHRDWSIKPNGQVWSDLVKHAWWTNVEGTTDADGLFQTRVFLGSHTVEVTAGEATQTLPVTVGSDGMAIEVMLPADRG